MPLLQTESKIKSCNLPLEGSNVITSVNIVYAGRIHLDERLHVPANSLIYFPEGKQHPRNLRQLATTWEASKRSAVVLIWATYAVKAVPFQDREMPYYSSATC